MTPWAKPLGIPLLAAPGPTGITRATIVTIAGALTDAATAAKAAYDAALAGDANGDGGYGNDVCLWVEALTAPGPLHAAIKTAGGPLGVPALRSAAVQFALARIVGVPVWKALGRVVPTERVASATACGLCQAASISNAVAHAQDTSGFVGSTASHPSTSAATQHGSNVLRTGAFRPRATFDPTGEHISACARVGIAANNKTRHDLFVRGVVGLATECGICAEYHDRPVFQTDALSNAQSDRRRPADWMEVGGEVSSTARDTHYAGRCFDLTIRTGDARALDAAVQHKHATYLRALQRNSHYGFSVFGISTNGRICREAADTLTRWEVNLVRHRRRNADLIGHPRREVRAAVGLLFASAMAAQAAAYVSQTNAAPTTARGDAHSRLLRVTRTQSARPAFRHFLAGFPDTNVVGGITFSQPPHKMRGAAHWRSASHDVPESTLTRQTHRLSLHCAAMPSALPNAAQQRDSTLHQSSSAPMRVDDDIIDSVIAELDYQQVGFAPYVSAQVDRHTAGASAAQWTQTMTRTSEHVNPTRRRGDDGDATENGTGTHATTNMQRTGVVCCDMRGVAHTSRVTETGPAGAQSLRD